MGDLKGPLPSLTHLDGHHTGLRDCRGGISCRGAITATPDDVRRNLFGPVDHALTKRLLTDELRRQNEEDRRRWNFHFGLERPEDGRWRWECALPGDIPAAYGQVAADQISGTAFDSSEIDVICSGHVCSFGASSPHRPDISECGGGDSDHVVSMETLTLSSSGYEVDMDTSFYADYSPLKIPSTPRKFGKGTS